MNFCILRRELGPVDPRNKLTRFWSWINEVDAAA